MEEQDVEEEESLYEEEIEESLALAQNNGNNNNNERDAEEIRRVRQMVERIIATIHEHKVHFLFQIILFCSSRFVISPLAIFYSFLCSFQFLLSRNC